MHTQETTFDVFEFIQKRLWMVQRPPSTFTPDACPIPNAPRPENPPKMTPS
jgi:hypothetical protein